MSDISRRLLIQSCVAGASLLPIATIAQTTATQRVQVPPAFGPEFEIKPLPFDPSLLEGLSEKLILSHWQNNYAGSVRALNTIRDKIQQALEDESTPAFVYNDLKREHLMRTGSVVLHEYYFDNLAAPMARDTQFDSQLAQAFGSASIWEREFRRIAAGLSGGSGWVVLAWNTHLKTLENYWMADHMHAPVSSVPILVMDMYEHSYHMDYGAAAAQYIDAFMNNINWPLVAGRLGSALTG